MDAGSVHGSTEADLAYADAVKRAAERFGANIVDTREYKDLSGGRRDDIGVIPPGRRASLSGTALAAAPDYEIIVVADEGQQFGYAYRGGGISRRLRPPVSLQRLGQPREAGATRPTLSEGFRRADAADRPPMWRRAQSASGEPAPATIRQGRGLHSRTRAAACALQGHQAAIPALGRAVPSADPDRHRQGPGLRFAAKGLPTREPSGDRGRHARPRRA
jgi:hypothetical protein